MNCTNHDKAKFWKWLSNYNFFCNFFLQFFFIYIKRWAKYYKENKEILQKNLAKDIKIFLKKTKKKSNNMVVNVTKISQKMKNKSLLSIAKNIEWKKCPLIIIRKSITFFDFQALQITSWNVRKFHFQEYNKLFKNDFFSFFELGKLLPEVCEVF